MERHHTDEFAAHLKCRVLNEVNRCEEGHESAADECRVPAAPREQGQGCAQPEVVDGQRREKSHQGGARYRTLVDIHSEGTSRIEKSLGHCRSEA